jgi:hypothetical protein
MFQICQKDSRGLFIGRMDGPASEPIKPAGRNPETRPAHRMFVPPELNGADNERSQLGFRPMRP